MIQLYHNSKVHSNRLSIKVSYTSSLLCTTQMTPKVFGIPALGFIGYITAIGLGCWLLFAVMKEHRKRKR